MGTPRALSPVVDGGHGGSGPWPPGTTGYDGHDAAGEVAGPACRAFRPENLPHLVTGVRLPGTSIGRVPEAPRLPASLALQGLAASPPAA